jgi:iron complex outermembrane receptor protein
MHKGLICFLAGTTALVGVSDLAFANGTEAGAYGLEEIVVTSRKREESLQDVPDAITTFSATAIEDAGITSVQDFVGLVPNLTLISSQNQGTVAINIRGIGQVRNGESPVAFVIDGVQISSPNQITQELYDIERIEVLKGPQGSLYGRNAIGGAINIVTKQPTNDFEHFVRLRAANGFEWKAQAGSSGPIIKDKLMYRVAASYSDFDGVIPNVTVGKDVDFSEDLNLRGHLLLYATDRLTFDLRMSYSDFDGGSSWYIPLADDMANDTTAPVQGNILGTGARELQEYALKIDYDADFATITSITAYSSTEETFFEELDWLAAPILAAEQTLDVEAWSEELRITSPSENRLRWMIGGYYLSTDRTIDTTVSLDLATSLLPVANPIDEGDNETVAGFGQASFDITPDLELTAGLRYDRDDRKQYSVGLDLLSEEVFSSWQPKVSLAYSWTDDIMTYATVAKGFRSGGFNQGSLAFPPLYRAETNWNYELGFKTQWADNRLELNGAFYWSDFDNQHVFLLDANTAAQGLVNINKTRIKGVELELRAQPLPSFFLSGGLGLQDATIRDFDGTGLYDGNQSPLVNEWSYNLSAQYNHDINGDLMLIARVDYTAKGDLAWHVDNQDRQKGHHLVDARLTLENSGGWQVTAFAKNLFNEKYTEEFFAREFVGTVTDIRWPNTPRRYGVETTFRF